MLTHLSIQGLAVIESLEIAFEDGFNVITGETGAGKSILIKALGLLLGGKTSPETVRSGFTEASIAGQFHLEAEHPVVAQLRDLEIPAPLDDGAVPVLVRRKLNAKGRSQAWVNDVLVTSQSLREIGENLIDIFAQHESQKLLDPREHLSYVDAFLDDEKASAKYREAYGAAADCLREIKQFLETISTRQRNKDYLQFRLQELNDFGPSTSDYEAIAELSLRAGGLLQSRERLTRVQNLLDESADGESLGRPLRLVAKILGEISEGGESVAALAAQAEAAASQVDELSFAVARLAGGEDIDEAELEAAQKRIAEYQALFRKLAVGTAEELCAEHQKLINELVQLDEAQTRLSAELRRLTGLTAECVKWAEQLSARRQKAAKLMKAAIEKELFDLAMPGARVGIEFSAVVRTMEALDLAGYGEDCVGLYAQACDDLSGLSEAGAEKVQIMFSANPGEALYPLQKVASGGEVSRIMLAIKRALSAGAESCLLVFDEIDSGISGKVADMVGLKLKELSKHYQLLCISHLAQVAAYADSHFIVRKQGRAGRTESQIIQLSRKESVEELARLLSGTEITKQSLANAKALVDKAQKHY